MQCQGEAFWAFVFYLYQCYDFFVLHNLCADFCHCLFYKCKICFIGLLINSNQFLSNSCEKSFTLRKLFECLDHPKFQVLLCLFLFFFVLSLMTPYIIGVHGNLVSVRKQSGRIILLEMQWGYGNKTLTSMSLNSFFFTFNNYNYANLEDLK